MICTFGDTTDVVWWRELQLPMRNVLGRDGRVLATAPEWGSDVEPEAATATPSSRARRSKQAQKRDRRAARRDGRARRRAEADHAPGEVLRAAAAVRSRS